MIGQIQPKTFIVHTLHTKSIRNQNNLFIAKEKQSKNYHGLSKMFRFSLFTYEILVALISGIIDHKYRKNYCLRKMTHFFNKVPRDHIVDFGNLLKSKLDCQILKLKRNFS